MDYSHSIWNPKKNVVYLRWEPGYQDAPVFLFTMFFLLHLYFILNPLGIQSVMHLDPKFHPPAFHFKSCQTQNFTTFAWLESYRRLSKDFEFQPETSQVMIQLAMVKLMLNKIKK